MSSDSQPLITLESFREIISSLLPYACLSKMLGDSSVDLLFRAPLHLGGRPCKHLHEQKCISGKEILHAAGETGMLSFRS